MKKTSRRSFAKSVAIGLAGIPLIHSPVSAQRNRKPRRKGWVSDADLEIRQTSPITVGGGGSVGIAFDETHYHRVSKGVYRNDTDELVTTLIAHQNGNQLRNFVKEIKGKNCTVKISCVDAGGVDTPPITIESRRHGPLIASFDEDAYTKAPKDPNYPNQVYFYNGDRHVKSVVVTSGGKTYPYDMLADWKGIIWVDDV